jgi:hypothetical protein
MSLRYSVTVNTVSKDTKREYREEGSLRKSLRQCKFNNAL